MYNKIVNNWIKHLDFILLDILAMEVSFVLAYIIRLGYSSGSLNVFSVPIYKHMFFYLILVNPFVVLFTESFKNVLKRNAWQEFKATLLHISLVAIIISLLFFVLGIGNAYSRLLFIIFICLYVYLSFILRIVNKKRILRSVEKNPNKQKRTSRILLVVSNSKTIKQTIERIFQNNFNKFYVKGIYITDSDMTGKKINDIEVTANNETIENYLKENWIDEIYLDNCVSYECMQKITDISHQMGITLHTKIADMENDTISNIPEEMFDGYVLTQSVRIVNQRQFLVKRLFDILGGIVGTLITGILFLFIAPAIYIKSPGSIFFTQTRVGKNGKLFKMYKFRTMYLDAEKRKKELVKLNKVSGGLMFKIDDDPRIIGSEKKGKNGKPKGIGNFLRRTSLDEFPQFINVLKGDMSLVGTRPPTVDEYLNYELYHHKRLAVKPGITGMWQVSGRSKITDFDEIVRLDVEYISNWSFWLDIKILCKTFSSVIKKDGAY